MPTPMPALAPVLRPELSFEGCVEELVDGAVVDVEVEDVELEDTDELPLLLGELVAAAATRVALIVISDGGPWPQQDVSLRPQPV